VAVLGGFARVLFFLLGDDGTGGDGEGPAAREVAFSCT
jgi:hypothetical protein